MHCSTYRMHARQFLRNFEDSAFRSRSKQKRDQPALRNLDVIIQNNRGPTLLTTLFAGLPGAASSGSDGHRNPRVNQAQHDHNRRENRCSSGHDDPLPENKLSEEGPAHDSHASPRGFRSLPLISFTYFLSTSLSVRLAR